MRTLLLVLVFIFVAACGLQSQDIITLPPFSVTSVSDDGCFVDCDDGHQYYIYGFSGFSDRHYGSILVKSGYSVIGTTVLGVNKRVEAFKVLTDDEKKRYDEAQAKKQAEEDKILEEQRRFYLSQMYAIERIFSIGESRGECCLYSQLNSQLVTD